MIVFCKNCKHYDYDLCDHPSNIKVEIDYNAYYKVNIKRCNELNSDNNCQNFESSLYYKIKKFFIKGA